MNWKTTFVNIFLSIIVFSIISGCATDTKTPTVNDVLNNIDTLGPKETVNRLYGKKTDNGWNFVMNQVAMGKSEWISIVPKLAPGTDAATSEDLGIYLADGLTQNPVAVLSVLDVHNLSISPKRVCGFPFIEPYDQKIHDYFEHTEAALSKVSAPELQSIKHQCMVELQQIKSKISERKDL